MNYPLPTTAIISDLNIEHYTPSFHTEMMSLRTEAKERGLHRLEGSFNVTLNNLSEQKAWNAFLLKLRGRANTFTLALPLHFTSDVVTNPTLAASGSIGANQITVSTFTGTIEAGSCFNLPNDPKVYYFLEDVIGAGTYDIYPSLIQSQLSGATINVQSPVITARMDTDKPSISYSENGILLEQSINFIEAY